MSTLELPLNVKEILRRAEPVQSRFIAVRFNARTGKTLLDRATVSESLSQTKSLAAADNPHKAVRIIELQTRVIRRFDTPAGQTEMVEIPAEE